MVGYLRFGNRGRHALLFLGIAALGALGAFAAVALAGTKTGAVLALICIFGPALLYAAIVSPLAFPFLLYLAVVPFDNLLVVSSFGTLTKLLGGSSAAALLFYILRTRRANSPPKLMAAWMLLYMWMFATTFWGLDPDTSYSLLPTAVMLFGLYFIVSLVPLTYTDLRRAVMAMIGGFTAAAAYGAYLFHTGAAVAENGRLLLAQNTSFIDPNHFAAALLLPIALTMMAALREHSWMRKACYLAALLVLLGGLAVSQSRGAILGLAAIIVYMFIRTPYRKQLGVVLGIMLVGAGVMFGHVFVRFGQALANGGGGRWYIWKVGLEAFKSHWLIGAGYFNFAAAYDQSYISVFQRFAMSFHKAAHDLLLQTGVELGVIGLVLVLAVWYGQFGLLKHITKDDPRFGLRIAAEAAVLGLFIAALFLDLMTMKYTWLTFMLVLMIRNATPERTPNGSPVSPVLPAIC